MICILEPILIDIGLDISCVLIVDVIISFIPTNIYVPVSDIFQIKKGLKSLHSSVSMEQNCTMNANVASAWPS